ncbi:MAG: hypothetical protein KGJ80_01855 [Chloroflexota bacterium]|nr:hypothetical protein [Chloroflexota bacterium]
MFEATYQPLSSEHPDWGQVAVLPWDMEIFGFPVGDLKLGDPRSIVANRTAFAKALGDWARRNQVELVSCAIAAGDTPLVAWVQGVGFSYVDSTVQIIQARIQKTDFAVPRVKSRCAEPGDEPAVERIAEHAFRSGRYHADPLFPRDLSERRYRHWVRNAFSTLSPENAVYVMGEPGNVKGFSHIQTTGDSGYVTIIAVDKDLQGGMAGYDLCLGLMVEWKRAKLRKVVGKTSAANMAMLNMALNFGFRLANPQVVLHWHAPNAPHLIPRDMPRA